MLEMNTDVSINNINYLEYMKKWDNESEETKDNLEIDTIRYIKENDIK